MRLFSKKMQSACKLGTGLLVFHDTLQNDVVVLVRQIHRVQISRINYESTDNKKSLKRC